MSAVADAALRIPVRGGEVTLSEESLVLRRSTLASSLFADLEVDVARLRCVTVRFCVALLWGWVGFSGFDL